MRVPDDAFGAPHLFTTRRGGVSTGSFALANLGDHVGDDPTDVAVNRERAAASFGRRASDVRWARQVHGRAVWNVDGASTHPPGTPPEADALISSKPGTIVAVAVADCVPLLLFDPITATVAAVHAGWRGAAVGVVDATLVAMRDGAGTEPRDVRAVVGPSIAGSCYQVGRDVFSALSHGPGADAAIRRDPDVADRWRVDVATIVVASLVAGGVREQAITRLPGCTFCDVDTSFSHRRDGPRTGRQAALVQVPFSNDAHRS